MTARCCFGLALACVGGFLGGACAREPGPRVEMVAVGVLGRNPAADPALAVDPATSDWLLTWVGADASGKTWNVWFSRSPDQGATWHAPVQVTDVAHDVHPHGESSPRVVVSPKGVIAAVWVNSIEVTGRRWPASNVRFSRSIDGGRTWSKAVTLNDDTTAAPGGHIFHGAAWTGDSTILVAWLDERGGAVPGDSAGHGGHPGHHPPRAPPDGEADARVYAVGSSDGGARWAPNTPLWGAACPCCRVSLARGPNGTVIAAWRKHFPQSVRDPVIAAIGTAGRSAAPLTETRVATDDWVYPGCPHTGPGIAVDIQGITHVAWYTGKPGAAGVYYTRNLAASAEFAKPLALFSARTLPTAHPRVAALPNGEAIVASDIDEKGRSVLSLARIGKSEKLLGRSEVPESNGAGHPDVVALSDGTALVAWTQREGDRTTVKLARVRP
ncbi:MAG TPA: sialidase family protein [Gemmatimonadales bacterium]|nr:sialidase family protein [Gemmatimonadales bacterium]